MTKYWLGRWNSKLGLAVMRTRPSEGATMVAAIMLPQAAAESLGKVIALHLVSVEDGDAIFDRSES
jgi:hypothetical protein